MLGIYFSGTGKTKFCVERLLKNLDQNANMLSIEEENAIEAIKKEQGMIVLGYPTHYSNVPFYVRQFLEKNGRIFTGKKILIVVSMGLFSGDGAGCGARILKKYDAQILGGLHVVMPDSILDVKALKKTQEKNSEIIKNAEKNIDEAAEKILKGSYPKTGLSAGSFVLGLLGQRLWFYGKTNKYYDHVQINSEKCIGCGKCEISCPMHNIVISDGKAIPRKACAMCYRCVTNCPVGAIHILGKEENLPQNRLKEIQNK